MILLRWLVFLVLLLGAAVLAAWWLRRGARVPLMMLAVAAGFSLLSLLVEILVIAAIRAAGVRSGGVRGRVRGPDRKDTTVNEPAVLPASRVAWIHHGRLGRLSVRDVATRPARRSSRTLKAFIVIVMVSLFVGGCLPGNQPATAPTGPAHVWRPCHDDTDSAHHQCPGTR
jgi:hypothetical protein